MKCEYYSQCSLQLKFKKKNVYPVCVSIDLNKTGTSLEGYRILPDTEYFRIPNTFGYRILSDTEYFRIPNTIGYRILSDTEYYRIPNTTGYRILPDTEYYRIPNTIGYQILPNTIGYRILPDTKYYWIAEFYRITVISIRYIPNKIPKDVYGCLIGKGASIRRTSKVSIFSRKRMRERVIHTFNSSTNTIFLLCTGSTSSKRSSLRNVLPFGPQKITACNAGCGFDG